ncbi:MAG: beta-ketoacyl-[acyl-carrier-protein] synthase family protein [Bacteroidota bacterium]
MNALRRPDGGHRVVVTGMGAVHGFGLGVDALWRGVAGNDCAITPTTLSWEDLQLTVPAARIPGYRATDHFSGQQCVLLDPFSQYAVLAAREAVAHSGLSDDPQSWRDTAVIFGNGGGGEITREDSGGYLFRRRSGRVHPLTVPRTNHQAVASHIAAEFGAKGPAYVISTGCASGSHALGQAAWLIRSGIVSRVISGGCEANIIYSVACAFSACRVITQDTCRPFSRDRSGFAFGEGSGVMILESLESATTRGARIHGEILGVGMSIDPIDQVQPSLEGPTLCLQRALAEAGRQTTDVQYISAHGTGTVLNDKIESQAVRGLFGAHADRIALSSSKSQLGHSFGASGALEAIICLQALEHQRLPPTVNWTAADPECDIDPVANESRSAALNCVISQSFGFGGVNAALVLAAPVT